MKLYLSVLFYLFFLLVACEKTYKQEENIFNQHLVLSKETLENWNSETIRIIDSEIKRRGANFKLNYIKSSLQNKKESDFPNYNLLKRDAFFDFLTKEEYFNGTSSFSQLAIIEIHTTGERNYSDNLVILTHGDLSEVYLFTQSGGGWFFEKRETHKGINFDSFFNEEPNYDSKNSWGSDIEEFLIVSIFADKEVKSKVFVSLSKNQLEKLNQLLPILKAY